MLVERRNHEGGRREKATRGINNAGGRRNHEEGRRNASCVGRYGEEGRGKIEEKIEKRQEVAAEILKKA